MSYRQTLDEAIGDAPVSTVDVDRIISRQRRAGTLRIWGTSGAGAAVALTVTLVVTTVPGPTASTVQPAIGLASTAGTTEDILRLEHAVNTALKREAPDITFLPTRQPGDQTPPGHFSTRREIDVDGARGTVIVQVARYARSLVDTLPCDQPVTTTGECRRTFGPDGIAMRITENARSDGNPSPYLFRTVSMLREDGALVTVYLSSPAAQGRLPLTAAQTTAVASDRTLTPGTWPPGLELAPAPTRLPTAPGDAAQRERLDRAAIAALRKQLPEVRALGPGGSTTGLESQWRGDDGDNTVDSYQGEAQILLDHVPGTLSIRISRAGTPRTCGTPGTSHRCAEGRGPHGESVLVVTDAPGRGRKTAERTVTVLRKDGSSIEVRHVSGRSDGALLLTEPQQKAIALDPALVLTPR